MNLPASEISDVMGTPNICGPRLRRVHRCVIDRNREKHGATLAVLALYPLALYGICRWPALYVPVEFPEHPPLVPSEAVLTRLCILGDSDQLPDGYLVSSGISGSGCGVADALDVDTVSTLVGLGEIALHLKAKPDLGAASEGFGKPDCHLGRDAGLSVHKVIEGLPPDTQTLGGFFDGKPERFDALLPNDSAGMGRILHDHCLPL